MKTTHRWLGAEVAFKARLVIMQLESSARTLAFVKTDGSTDAQTFLRSRLGFMPYPSAEDPGPEHSEN
jgi:hypothetical protein